MTPQETSVRGDEPSRASARVRRRRGVHTELGLVATGLACYFVVRWYTADRTDQAISNAEDVLALQQALGLDWEHAIQDATLTVPSLGAFCTHFYVWGYLPVMVGVTVWLYACHRGSYPMLRNALLAAGAVGLTVYALYPCAPPWIVGGFTDTVTDESLSFAARPLGITNELGAIPSFHVGWLVVASVVTFRATRSRLLRVLCVLHPLVMCYAVVATGNHWVLDIPAGAALAGVGLLVATCLSRGATRARPDLLVALVRLRGRLVGGTAGEHHGVDVDP